MVLVDTSVWINHLQKGSDRLARLLCEAEVVSHPFVIGELACGNIKNRKEILSLLQRLPLSPVVENNEFHYFLERNKLMGRGLGFVDIHLLASARLKGLPLWTADKKLKEVATNLSIAYS
jgi:predicted nucleic acid-binding protein